MAERRLPHLSNRFMNQQAPEKPQTQPPTSQAPLHYENEGFRPQNHMTTQNMMRNDASQMPRPDSQTHGQNLHSNEANEIASGTLSSQIGKKKGPHKIDSSQIPRPIVHSEASFKPIRFDTSRREESIPQAHQNFIVTEEGNAGPRHIRASTYSIPNDPSLFNNTFIPFGVVVQPLADVGEGEEEVPLIYPLNEAPFRCSRCKTYINSFFQFTDSGNTTICNICKMANTVPADYYSLLDESGKRKDRYTRPELYKGVYEIVAPKEYYNKSICENHLMICLELSVSNVINGVFSQVISSLQSLLEHIPNPERTNICIMTFDQHLNFYNVPQDLTKELQIVVVSDNEDVCVPLPVNKIFLNLANEKEKLDYLIDKISKFSEALSDSSKINNPNKPNFAAGSLGYLLLNAVHCFKPHSGRVLVFTSQMPVNGFGKLKRRDDYKLIGTEKEKTLYLPQVDTYEKLAKTYLDERISLDLFVINSEFFDLATIHPICALTGGSLYYYSKYNGIYDGERLHYDLARNLTRYYAYDVIMTVRTSSGIVLNEYYTGYGKMAVRDLELSTLDADKTIGISLKHEEKITDSEAYIQYAILYTNPYGQRIIRVINLSLQVTNNMSNVFRVADVDCSMQLFIRKNLKLMTSIPINVLRENIKSFIVNLLYSYRINCASSSSAGQLILPDAYKLLPLYLNSLFKHDALKLGNDVRPDDRIYSVFKFLTGPLYETTNILYPKFYPLHNIYNNDNEFTPGNTVNENCTILPSNLPLTIEKIENHGIYLIDYMDTLYLYILKDADPQQIRSLLGVENFNEIVELVQLPYLENEDFSVRLAMIIDRLRKQRNSCYQNVRIVTEKDPALDQFVLNLLLEDEVRNNESYPDFLCKLHLLIQQKYK